jgi:ParB family transcriptional regulator, chromosome partitioning protein
MKLVETGSFPISDIEIGTRLRVVDEVWAQGLADIIAQTGLQNPIQIMKVDNTHRLVAGAHRLAAYILNGQDHVPAMVYEPETDDVETEIREQEIVENVGRRELSALDRAAHIAELRAIHAKRHGDSRGGDRKGEKSKRQSLPFWSLSEEISAKMGLSERTVRADAELFQGLSEASRKAVVNSYLADNRAQLAVLSKQPPADQKALLKILLAEEPKATSMAAALALHHNKVDLSTPDEKTFASFVKLWSKASGKARKQFVIYIEAQGAK